MSSAKIPPPQTKKKPAAKRRSVSPSPSTPELKLSYQPAGRDTLAAIDEELAHALPSPAEAPLIEISETAVGRDTMAAIAEELVGPGRSRQDTLPYPDKIKNAPGARSPSRAPAPPKADAPSKADAPKAEAPPRAAATPAPTAEGPDEVTVKVQRPPLPPTPSVEGIEIFELLTFIVRGTGVGDLSTDALRRKFVQDHLLRRVPSGSIDGVERIEVTPWTAKGTMVLRIWCKP